MSKIKCAIDVSNKLAEYVVTATDKCLKTDEQEYMHDSLFERLFEIFKDYDNKTLETLNKNL